MSAADRFAPSHQSAAPAVTAAWATAWSRVAQAHPTLVASPGAEDAAASFIAERLDGAAAATALPLLPVEDLALAAWCARGDAAAHHAFEASLSAVGDARVGGAQRHHLEEIKQQLRVQLLIAEGDKPAGIAAYRGRGPLRAWLKIIATRELIRLVKGEGRAVAKQEIDELPLVTTGDPALDQLKATYRNEFAAALRDAISDLAFEDRLLLRQQIADQLSIDEIGAAHGVHRGTAGRWLARARDALLVATQRRLAERLDLPAEEIASVIRLVHSKLDVSVVRYLRDSK